MSYFQKNKTVNIYRLTRSGDVDQYGSSPAYSDIDATILPASPEIMAIYPGQNAFQLHDMMIFDNITIIEGDKFIDVANGDQFIVRGAPRVFDTPRVFYIHCVGEKVVGQ